MLTWPVIAFLICAFVPWHWSIGSVIVSPYRLVLLVMTLPCLWIWVRGKGGGVRASDITILLYCLWCITSLTIIHGTQAGLQSGGIISIETAGAYLLGRCFIRGPEQYCAMIRLLFWIVAALLPFAVLEAFSSSNVLLEFFSIFFPTHEVTVNVPRWGVRRVQSVFEHPILFGVSCGAILALVHLVLGEKQSSIRRWAASALVLFTASLSLSSGPMTALTAQVFLLFWNWALRANEMRWRLLWALLFAVYVLISLVSNQTVPQFLMTHFSFDQGSAYYRVLIWNFGSESALNHPFFGVGFGRWDRPEWMPGSIDMFWLYHAVLFGLPAGILLLVSFLLTIISVSLRKGLDPKIAQYRTAFLIVMTSYFLVGWTVHFWNATYVLFLFLLGSGAWLVDVEPMPEIRISGARMHGTADPSSKRQKRLGRQPRANVRNTDEAYDGPVEPDQPSFHGATGAKGSLSDGCRDRRPER